MISHGLAGGAIALSIVWGAYELGHRAGGNACEADVAREERVAAVATDAAASAAANAISKIEVRNVTLRQPLETIVRTEKVFGDCRSGPDAVRLLNATAGAAAASAPGDGGMPDAGATR